MSKAEQSSQGAGARQGTDSGEATIKLLERFRAGDEAALEMLLARYRGPLKRWASGRLPAWARDGIETQDLVQETLIQTLRTVGTFEPRREGAFQAYLRQALMNRIRDEVRRVRRRHGPAGGLDSGLEDRAPSPLEQAIGRQAVDRYEAALARLRPEEREAIIGRVELGYSYEELAESLNKPTADAARKAAQRALVRLVAEMKRAGTAGSST
jgi:RNA polymerase sigma-70 factor (ECF subfamily)